VKIGKRIKVKGSRLESWQDGKPGSIDMEFRIFLPYSFSITEFDSTALDGLRPRAC
jgi:hypothetical protein